MNSLKSLTSVRVRVSPFFPDHSKSIDPATATVRDHIEKVVESLVGDNLDAVNIIKLSEEPQCESRKHMECLASMGQSIS